MTRALTQEERKEALERLARLDQAVTNAIHLAELGVLVHDPNCCSGPRQVLVLGDFVIVDLKK